MPAHTVCPSPTNVLGDIWGILLIPDLPRYRKHQIAFTRTFRETYIVSSHSSTPISHLNNQLWQTVDPYVPTDLEEDQDYRCHNNWRLKTLCEGSFLRSIYKGTSMFKTVSKPFLWFNGVNCYDIGSILFFLYGMKPFLVSRCETLACTRTLSSELVLIIFFW
jgi:hypothetical protein